MFSFFKGSFTGRMLSVLESRIHQKLHAGFTSTSKILLQGGNIVLSVQGAAPGGWLQFSANNLRKVGCLYGIEYPLSFVDFLTSVGHHFHYRIGPLSAILFRIVRITCCFAVYTVGLQDEKPNAESSSTAETRSSHISPGSEEWHLTAARRSTAKS